MQQFLFCLVNMTKGSFAEAHYGVKFGPKPVEIKTSTAETEGYACMIFYKYTTVFLIGYICVYLNKKHAYSVAKNHDNICNSVFRFFLTLRFATWLLLLCFLYSCY